MRILSWFAALYLLIGASSTFAQGKSQVRLLTDATEVSPGKSFLLAVELTPPSGWHTYWRNPGDSGQRTKVEWTLPKGITVGDLIWPVPTRLTEEGITSYIYEGPVLLLARAEVASNRQPGPMDISARISWLECQKECVPGRATATARVDIGPRALASTNQARLEAALAQRPQPDPQILTSAVWNGPARGEERRVELTASKAGLVDFFPYESSEVEGAPKALEFASEDGRSRAKLTLTKSGADWPAQLAGLLIFDSAGSRTVVEGMAPIRDASGAVAGVSNDGTPMKEPPAASAGAAPDGLLTMLGFAFLGGLILNIMPCVLPVIALKILGFVKQSRENPGRVRFLGFVYTVGILVSFAALAAIVIAVQSAGKTASWGMQFQNPVFLVALTTLVTLVTLNLFGVFEVTLASGAATAASGLAAKGGVAGAFFNGVFTTVLATPCTAPFLAGALGFAFGQPPLTLLALFLAAGAGLAAPYLLLCLQPAWLKFLPKPGNWMITFKVLMGFPMLGSALWLLSLAPDHFGEDGVFWVGLFLVSISLAAWIYGRFVQTGEGYRGLAWGGMAAAVIGGYFFALEGQLHWRSPAPLAARGAPDSGHGIAWETWSPEAVQKARFEGRPVLVDFTAKWCLTCRVNKAIAIEVPTVEAKLKQLNVAALLGDYTREDPLIAERLRKFGRAGVPLVLVYPRNPTLPPKVLPQQLTERAMLDALMWAAQ